MWVQRREKNRNLRSCQVRGRNDLNLRWDLFFESSSPDPLHPFHASSWRSVSHTRISYLFTTDFSDREKKRAFTLAFACCILLFCSSVPDTAGNTPHLSSLIFLFGHPFTETAGPSIRFPLLLLAAILLISTLSRKISCLFIISLIVTDEWNHFHACWWLLFGETGWQTDSTWRRKTNVFPPKPFYFVFYMRREVIQEEGWVEI